MSDTAQILENLRLALEIPQRLEYLQKLRDLCLQRVARIQQLAEADAMAATEVNAATTQLGSTANVLAGAEVRITELSERFGKVASRAGATSDKEVERTMRMVVGSLASLQSVFENELFMLDELIEILEGKLGS
jgi:hypothetical protein